MVPLFKYSKKAEIRLNKKQEYTRNLVQEKMDKGIYKMKDAPCLCGGRDDTLISETDRYALRLNFVICKKCGLPRINPQFDEESLIEFYKSEYRDLFMEFKDITHKYFNRMIKTGKGIVNLLKMHCSQIQLKGSKVLDMGCSAGGVLVPFLNEGAVVKGYDCDRRYLEYGNKYNSALNLSFGGFENLKNGDKKYDLIICNHVLEHLTDPKKAVELMRNSLKPNSLLYIGVPNLKNPMHYASPTKSFLGAVHISHVFYFTKMSLMRLLEKLKLIYIDDEICALFKNEEPAIERTFASEYITNLEFIRRYERSIYWKAKRSIMLLSNGLKMVYSYKHYGFSK